MSLILDALRKMEQERKARLGKRPDFRPEVMRKRERYGRKTGHPFIFWASALILIVAGISGGIYLRSGAPSSPAVAEEVGEEEQVMAAIPGPPPAPQMPPAVATPPTVAVTPPPQPTPPPAPPREETYADSAAPAGINLMGIAWQEERSARKAVVNGSLVGEGAVIDGARIVEIKANRVIFSQGGSRFEISLSPPLAQGGGSERPTAPPVPAEE